MRQIELEICSLPKNHPYRKELGAIKFGLALDMHDLNKQIKRNSIIDRDLNEYILKVCRSRFARCVWLEILAEARNLKAEDMKENG